MEITHWIKKEINKSLGFVVYAEEGEIAQDILSTNSAGVNEFDFEEVSRSEYNNIIAYLDQTTSGIEEDPQYNIRDVFGFGELYDPDVDYR